MTHQDLKEAAMKATPGPWQLAPDEYRVFDTPPPDTVIKLVARVASNNCQRTRQARCNAAFIAIANPARILSLIEENERMREALTPFAEFNTKIDAHPDAAKTPDDYCIHDGLKVGDFRRAFSVIKEKP